MNQPQNGNRNPAPRKPNQRSKKNSNRAKKPDPILFWGDPAKLPVPEAINASTPDPQAVVRSLGTAPIPGTPAEPYFAVIYSRAAGLASVLGDIASAELKSKAKSTPSS